MFAVGIPRQRKEQIAWPFAYGQVGLSLRRSRVVGSIGQELEALGAVRFDHGEYE